LRGFAIGLPCFGDEDRLGDLDAEASTTEAAMSADDVVDYIKYG
jgi:hypothetical protein